MTMHDLPRLFDEPHVLFISNNHTLSLYVYHIPNHDDSDSYPHATLTSNRPPFTPWFSGTRLDRDDTIAHFFVDILQTINIMHSTREL